MTTLIEVYELFLSRIKDRDLALMAEEEMLEQLDMYVKVSLGRCIPIDDVDIVGDSFNRELTYLEKDLISLGMVLEWITPKILNADNMRNRVSDKDYSIFSQAKFITAMRELKEDASKDFYYFLSRYSTEKFKKKFNRK